ncbi:MAG: molybdopterin biosynthesis protein [Clostridiales bacterium]|nr:molybdopterin biosynthesis protein [Clostridiales bacterium]
MLFGYLSNTPLSEARENYTSALLKCGFTSSKENIEVFKSSGRMTASAVYARISAPHYNASAMDGIAVSANETFGATETTPVILNKDSFTVVDTGDPLPEGCDAVIMIEDVVMRENGSASLYAPASPWQHIRQIGEDICAGEMILPSFTKITPAAVGAMIAGGVRSVDVIKKPLVGIIPTGDEIVPPTADPKEGDILEFNSSVFSAMLKECGADTVTYPICPDEFDIIRETAEKAVSECDIVIINAGSSAGREDYTCGAVSSLGEVICHGIAVKPGKPAILGICSNKPVIGVPGYPVSGIIILEEIIKPLVDLWFNRSNDGAEEYIDAVMSRSVVSGLKYREFVRVRLGYVNGRFAATPLNRGAGVVSSFMKADGILEIPRNSEGVEAGEKVRVRLLRSEEELKNTLVAIGSHDPLLDEAADMIHRRFNDTYLSSNHVGSMGGITAVKRGEAHVAGTHLLNEADGVYNDAYIKKYFQSGGVRLVECVGRTQGIMMKSGNPLNISSIKDLNKKGLRYVNRQKGSGTRVLIDYLCKKENIDTSEIYGYDREEYTHTSVAAQIASGSADAGMGIYSAAKLYGLDFLPICTEQYDLLIPDYAWETEQVKKLLEVLKSDEFKNRLAEMGGYTVESPGRVRKHYEAK